MLAGVSALFIVNLSMSPVFASSESDNAREQAENILKEERYQKKKDQPLKEDAQRLTRWLGAEKSKPIQSRSDDEIQRLSSSRRQSTATPPAISGFGTVAQIVLIIILILIISAIVFFITKAVMNRKSSKKPKTPIEIDDVSEHDWSDEDAVLEEITDADLLDKLSIEAQNAGHFDIALRYRFRAGLLRLNDKKIISFHPSITNAQWQLILNNTLFDDLAKDFNDVTYGKVPCEISQLTKAIEKWPLVIDTKGGSLD